MDVQVGTWVRSDMVSLRINQHQSASISINQHQSATKYFLGHGKKKKVKGESSDTAVHCCTYQCPDFQACYISFILCKLQAALGMMKC